MRICKGLLNITHIKFTHHMLSLLYRIIGFFQINLILLFSMIGIASGDGGLDTLKRLKLLDPDLSLTKPKILSLNEAFKIERLSEKKIQVVLGKSIYLYDNKTYLEDLEGNTLPDSRADGHSFDDPIIGETKIHFHGLVLTIEKPMRMLVLKYQGCSLDGFCYPPQKKVLSLNNL